MSAVFIGRTSEPGNCRSYPRKLVISWAATHHSLPYKLDSFSSTLLSVNLNTFKMSAILSADDLNDFIAPGAACIKPVETLPAQQPQEENAHEVTREDKVVANAAPAQISLTDCLACSGCVTSAETVLISLQSHAEVLSALDAAPPLEREARNGICQSNGGTGLHSNGDLKRPRIYVASVSPQVRASLAATYSMTERESGWLIDQLLSGPDGLASGGKYGNSFSFVVDTNAMREVALYKGAEEVSRALTADAIAKKPVLTSACPGWVCYAEKTHPHILPHLSRVKSPQALTGILLKTVLSKLLGVTPDQIWHLAIMPCFDKKLEASRAELTSASWQGSAEGAAQDPARDVDCVITAREILMLADSRGISLPNLPKKPLDTNFAQAFPDKPIADFLFSSSGYRRRGRKQTADAGTSGGFLYHVLCSQQKLHPGAEVRSQQGRNSDVAEFSVVNGEEVVFRAARYYGFKNITNLVRKLRPATENKLAKKVPVTRRNALNKAGANDYTYIEVMACPGGCTNGGGQIKIDDLGSLQGRNLESKSQRDWLAFVDEAYYSTEEGEDVITDTEEAELSVEGYTNGISTSRMKSFLQHWESLTGISLEDLIWTSFREVHSDVGKPEKGNTERVAEIAARIGGGW